MTSATLGQWQTVSPTRDCGIPKRCYIPETSIAMPQSQHDQLQTSVDDERIAVLLNLQRTLGLRFKESALLDAQKALRQAQQQQFQFHGQRHHYAQQRYRALTGAPAPINTTISKSTWHSYMAAQLCISLEAAEALDQRARSIVSDLLTASV